MKDLEKKNYILRGNRQYGDGMTALGVEDEEEGVSCKYVVVVLSL